jgi:protein required for attachment to host cells
MAPAAKTWIVLLNRLDCVVYERLGRGKKLDLVYRFENTAGQAPEREAILSSLCEKIASLLEAEDQKAFDYLFLISEPKTLGVLRKSLTLVLERKVVGSLSKELLDLTELEIIEEMDWELDGVSTASPSSSLYGRL